MDIDKLALLTYVLPSYNTEMAKFRSGYLFKEILDRSTNKTNGLLVPDRSLWMYSTHETVIASFLYALGVFNVGVLNSAMKTILHFLIFIFF